jgi:Tol biopolymer transport system component
MPFPAGTQLGPYKILATIGAGGMGEVYKARDTRLDRDVAIKVAQEKFSDRFEREARSIAALNHPNICQLYDVGPNYLVMELIEGESPRGPLPVDAALGYARQIAAGLDAAHEKGIVHRDLKPANIKVTPAGVVKVLDFGIAKMTAPAGGDSESSPTFTMATQAGAVLGTAAYMSPEQARGKTVDKRADIWAFGVVLYEMIAGKRPFEGETVSDVVAKVIASDPNFEILPDPPRSIVEKCLRKDPRRRWRDIGDVAMALDESPPAALPPRAPQYSRLPFVAAAIFCAIAIIVSIALWRATRAVEQPAQRFDLPFSSEAAVYNAPALSPDGTKIAYLGRLADGNIGLQVRHLDQAAAKPLEGTDNAVYPFFSPDGEWIGYFANGALLKINAEGGASVRLADASDPRGGSWGDDDRIVFTPALQIPLMEISATGGAMKRVTELAPGEFSHRWPRVLPGSDLIAYVAGSSMDWTRASAQIWSRKAHAAKTLQANALAPHYSPSGHLLWIHDRTLFAAPLNLARLELSGPSAPVLQDVETDGLRGGGAYDVSLSGALAALTSRGNTSGIGVFSLQPDGATELLADGQGGHIRYSPDGKHVLWDTLADGRASRVLIYDFARAHSTILNLTSEPPFLPIWTPDGRHLAFATAGGRVYWARADGSGEPQLLFVTPGQMNDDVDSFSPDGRTLVFTAESHETKADLWTVSLDLADPDQPKAREPKPLIRTPDVEREGVISPDGKWLAYYAAESGHRGEVYVQPFPLNGAKWRISDGAAPEYSIAWARNARELFYESSDSRIMVVGYAVKDGAFSAEQPRPWSEKRIDGSYPRAFDMSPDGKRAIVFLPSEQKNRPPVNLTFVLNFSDELRRRAPVGR